MLDRLKNNVSMPLSRLSFCLFNNLSIPFGYFVGKGADFTYIFCIYILMSVIYSGIYLMNDLFDVEYDRKHPEKCRRLYASGRISRRMMVLLILALMCVPLIILGILNPVLFYLASMIIVINLLYSRIMKHIPLLDIMFNIFPHPLRFMIGFYASGSLNLPVEIILLYLFGGIPAAAAIRMNEIHRRHHEMRPVIRYYSLGLLRLMSLIGILVALTIMLLPESAVTRLFSLFLIAVGVYCIVLYRDFNTNMKRLVLFAAVLIAAVLAVYIRFAWF